MRNFSLLPFSFCHEYCIQFSSVAQLCPTLRPHELQHARPPCPSPTPGVHSESSPSSQWCHPAISSSVFPFSPCPQSLPASESFPMSQLFAWGGISFSIILSKEIPGLISFKMDWLDLLAVQGTLKNIVLNYVKYFTLINMIMWISLFCKYEELHWFWIFHQLCMLQ